MWLMFAALAGLVQEPAEPVPYPGIADPVAFMSARYGEYRRGVRPSLPADTYASARLRRHFYAADEAAGGEEVDSLDFWIDDPDEWVLSGLGLTLEPARTVDRQTVTARFRNEGRGVLLRFHFVREDGRWWLDEVVKPGRRGWTLTQRLAIRPRARPNP
jgi:hypothetical protein